MKICSIGSCTLPVLARDWCENHYRRWQRHGSPLAGGPPKPQAPRNGDQVQRFWSKVNRLSDDNECWIWEWGTTKKGYGIFDYEGKGIGAHVMAWRLAHPEQTIGKLECICHTCDNPPCCNPKHLVKKDRIWNNQDKMNKGRHRVPVGEHHPQARLTVSEVKEILQSKLSQIKLSTFYSVSPATICLIKKGKLWKEVFHEINGGVSC